MRGLFKPAEAIVLPTIPADNASLHAHAAGIEAELRAGNAKRV
jgi:hypothetical protein